MIRAVNNTILVRPNYEALTRTSKLHHLPGEVETKEFGKVSVGSAHTYKNTAGANNIAWGTVESVGRGAAWMLDKYRLDKILRPGDVIGFDSQRQVSTDHQGGELYMVPVDAALCLFNPGMERPKPLGVYMMTEEEDGAVARFMFRNPETAKRYAMTADMRKGEMKVSDSPWSRVKFTLERVLDVGPGGMGHSEIKTVTSRTFEKREEVRVDGETMGIKGVESKVLEKIERPVVIQPDPEAVGLLAAFLPTMSVAMNFHGKRLRFTNWDRCRFLWDGS